MLPSPGQALTNKAFLAHPGAATLGSPMSAPVEEKKGPLAKFAPFPKPFWVINGVELFERGAYYGMLAVLAVFLAGELQFPAYLTGVLLAIQFPLLYFLPVVSGAIADKYGFKKLLVASFIGLIGGYVVLGLANNFWIGLAGIVLYGIGAGLFKPMPAAMPTSAAIWIGGPGNRPRNASAAA